ncbi:MAG: type 1 glutamine amidotransferase [Silanimonas sp.]
MTTRLHVLQHHPAEGPARIAPWAASRGIALNLIDTTRDALPTADPRVPWVLMGGPANIDGAPEWLRAEIDAVRRALDAGVPILGVCLGAQIIAAALGAAVGPLAPEEAGWCEVVFVDGTRREFLQWHGQGHAVPPGAEGLAHSADWPCQMFRVGPRVIGLQFHPEWDGEALARLHAAFGADCPLPRPDADDPVDVARHAAAAEWLEALLDGWAALSSR